MRYLACLLVCLTLAACTSPDTCAAINPSNPATETFDPSLNVDLTQFSKTQNGVYTQDVVVGTGDKLIAPQTVQVYYTAYLTNGTLVDKKLNQPFTMDLRSTGAFGLIDGMMGMNVGGRRRIIVPSDLALGSCALGPIPANSTLIYEIELLAISP
jgi:FKBP-type peptidyl-prolyl cis-trans isomerase FkpA